MITGKHYAKFSGPKLNKKSENRNCESAKAGNCNETEEPSEN